MPMSLLSKEAQQNLHKAISPARSILEIIDRKSYLGAEFKISTPDANWITASFNESEQKLEITDPKEIANGCEAIVIDFHSVKLHYPLGLFTLLRQRFPRARLLCAMRNMTHISVIEKMLLGDLTHEIVDLQNDAQCHFYSQGSVFKLLLDAGWLPKLISYTNTSANPNFFSALTTLGKHMRVPEITSKRNLLMVEFIIESIAAEAANTLPQSAHTVSVVVPVNHELQFKLNVLQSPGLREIDAKIIPIMNAKSAAEAYELGAAQTESDWILYCHQDVYFPSGFGYRLQNVLSTISSEDAVSTIIGFTGLATQEGVKSGLVIDRINLFDFPDSDRGISIDELAIVLHKKSPYRLDPNLGWHVWATDLCLQSIHCDGKYARIVRIPLFHNSLSDWTLPQTYYDSAAKLLAKYPQMKSIPTLCGILQRSH